MGTSSIKEGQRIMTLCLTWANERGQPIVVCNMCNNDRKKEIYIWRGSCAWLENSNKESTGRTRNSIKLKGKPEEGKERSSWKPGRD